MGFHICEYCKAAGKEVTADGLSSGDVLLIFANGHTYEVPDMIVHYVESHDYKPPTRFIADVIRAAAGVLEVTGQRVQTRGLPQLATDPILVGYLAGEFPACRLPGFAAELKAVISKCQQQPTVAKAGLQKSSDTLRYAELKVICAAAMQLAATNPGRYGGRYVARIYNRKLKHDEFLVLATDDPDVYREDKNLDILAQVTSREVLPLGRARHWLNKDGTVSFAGDAVE